MPESPIAESPTAGVPAVFRHQPRWVLPALCAILLVAALLYSYNIGYSGLSTYYASAAKSMSGSWQALLTGAMNPSATMTLDKLSGFVVPQALAIRLFGFHAWALTLPQVIEGLVTILASYVIGARWRGPAIGIATAAVMTVTPMLAAMFGHPMEDGLLTMTMVLAFAAWQRSLLSGHTRWFFLAGLWVAVGFQAKMMQAWLIVPALLLGILLAGEGPLRRRIARAAMVGAVTGLLSISWMTAIQLMPAHDRPYVDGTTNNNMFSMVFGYNGVDRLIPGVIPGSVPQLDVGSGQSVPNATRTEDAAHSPLKMVLPEISSQIGWLYPTALAGLVFEVGALARRWRTRNRTDTAMVGALVTWLGVTSLVLAGAFVPHATYFGVIALPLALLAVVGGARAIRWYRAGAPGGRRAALPVLVGAQTAWQSAIVLGGASALAPLAPVIGAAGAVALILLLLARARERARRAAVGVAVAAGLIAPIVWSSFVLLPGGGGSASDAYAGARMEPSSARELPRVAGKPSAPAILPVPAGRLTAAIRHPFAVPPDPRLNAAQRQLVAYVVARNGGRRTLFATDTLAVAVSVILFSRYDAQPMGGFSRQAPTTDAAAIAAEVAQQRLRFVLLADIVPSAGNSAIVGVRNWVQLSCAPVLHGDFRDGSTIPLTLYDCGR